MIDDLFELIDEIAEDFHRNDTWFVVAVAVVGMVGLLVSA
jgi:hypothetical protein